MAEQPKRPAAEFRVAGGVKAVVWRNETEHGPRYSTVLQRVYKNGDDWKTTDSLGHADLLAGAFALQQAYAWVLEQQHAEPKQPA